MQNGRRLSFRPAVETLEDRSLMAAHLTATLAGGVLRIDGTSADDVIAVRENSGRISVDHVPIHICGSGDDTIVSQSTSDDIDGGYGRDTANVTAGRSPGTLRSIEVTNTQPTAQAIVAVTPKAAPPMQAAVSPPTTATVSLSAVVRQM